MAVEIRELVIRATIVPDKGDDDTDESAEGAGDMSERADIVRECVRGGDQDNGK